MIHIIRKNTFLNSFFFVGYAILEVFSNVKRNVKLHVFRCITEINENVQVDLFFEVSFLVVLIYCEHYLL